MSNPIGSWRYRLNLTSTVKEGFRVGDVTVEFTEAVVGGGEVPREEIRARLRALIEDGEQVAAQLNRQNALAKTSVVTAPRTHQEGTTS